MGETFDFGLALAVMRAEGRVARAGWNGKGMWVCLSPGFTLDGPGRAYAAPIKRTIQDEGEAHFRPYLMMRTVDGEFVPWVASQTDLLAEDWQHVQ
jgi:hypothetical protein